MEDPDAPINLNGDDQPESKRYPVNDPNKHPERQSLVCRVPNGMQAQVPLTELTAGGSLRVKWEFTANHPGDGGLYLSYDASTAQTQEMRFFKIANFPQQRRNNRQAVTVALPSWLPAGKAVLRWDWYATHNAPWAEFYSNCVDVNIVSSSTVSPSAIPSHKMESFGTGSATAYPRYDCQDCWCFDCGAADWKKKGINGPQCVGGVEGNCCDITQYNPVDYDAGSGGGFNTCKDKGNSGPATFVSTATGGSGEDNNNNGGNSAGGNGGSPSVTSSAASLAFHHALVAFVGACVFVVMQ